MYPTTEVRWFFKGTVPAAVKAWFLQLETVSPLERRTDHYLRQPVNDALSVKWREGRIEVKRRASDRKSVTFGAGVSGSVARWHKWSFSLCDATDVLNLLQSADEWVAVEKARWQLAFTFDESANVRSVAPWTMLPQGCEAELTTVQACEQTWWTFAFEAFGKEEAQRTALHHGVRHVLQSEVPIILTAEASASYPMWMKTHLLDGA